MAQITSIRNPRIKQAIQLRRRRGRQQQHRIIVDGAREIWRALSNGVEAKELFVSSDLAPSELAEQILAHAESVGLRPVSVAPDVFRQLAFGDRDDGLVLVAARPDTLLDRIPLRQQSIIAVLENIEKPGNVGAVLRSADAAGVDAVILTGGGTDLFNPNAIRASMGAIFHVPVAVASMAVLHEWLQTHAVNLYAARVDGTVCYDAISYQRPAAIILGNEASGLSDQWQGPNVHAVRIPMRGIVDSLNVSVSAAILFYAATNPNDSGPV